MFQARADDVVQTVFVYYRSLAVGANGEWVEIVSEEMELKQLLRNTERARFQ